MQITVKDKKDVYKRQVLFFMPAMILKFSRWNDKTRHRPFLPSFRKFKMCIRDREQVAR